MAVWRSLDLDNLEGGIRGERFHVDRPASCLSRIANRSTPFARAFDASTSRSRGGAFVTSASRNARAARATSSTPRAKAASLALDGLEKPLNFRTNCSEDARISSSVAGGLKLYSVLMLRHMLDPPRALCLPYGLRPRPYPVSGRLSSVRQVAGSGLDSGPAT